MNEELVEQGNEIVDRAAFSEVALLVIGDPLAATTHIDLWMRAKKEKIKVEETAEEISEASGEEK